MKGTLVLAALLLLLLPVLALLQYHWLGDVAKAERTELQAALHRHVDVFAEDCDEEATSLFMALQSSGGSLTPATGAELQRRLHEWSTASRVPQLVRHVYLVEAGSSERPPVAGADPVLLVPLFAAAGGESVHGRRWAVAILNQQFLTSVFFPELLKRTFLEGGRSPRFEIEIRKVADNTLAFGSGTGKSQDGRGAPDARVDLFRLRPELRFGSRDRAQKKIAGQANGIGVGVVAAGEVPSDAAGMSRRRGLYVLTARHVNGSLDAAVSITRRRNLMISFAIEAVLSTSIVLLMLSIRRTHAQAERRLAFVAGLSHDMRTPVTVIRNLAQNQSRGLVKDQAQAERYGGAILEHAARLSDCVERALGFASFRAGRLSRQKTPYSVCEVLSNAVSATASMYPEAAVRIALNCAPDLPELQGDPVAVDRAVQNLLVNAIKYSSNHSRVAVSAHRAGDHVEIAVEDQGWGISARDLKAVFKPFFRTGYAMKSQVTGTGLGLTLVKAIVEEHSGTVACTSKVGTGSTFKISLPIAMERSEGE